MACPSSHRESLKKAVSKAAHPKPTTYMEKRHLKHETSVMNSPCRGLTVESEKQEGVVSSDCNLFSPFILWEKQVLQGWFSWLWISCRFLHTRFRAVLICKCTLASRSSDEDITKTNYGIAARFFSPQIITLLSENVLKWIMLSIWIYEYLFSRSLQYQFCTVMSYTSKKSNRTTVFFAVSALFWLYIKINERWA